MSTGKPTSAADFTAAFKKSISDHWRLFLAEGVVLMLLGVAAIIIPPLAGLATTIILGWLFLIGGAVGLVATFGAHQAPGFAWSLFSAVVAVLAGGVLLWNPWQGLATLTYVLIAFFIIDGILIIILALQHHRELTGRWEWMMTAASWTWSSPRSSSPGCRALWRGRSACSSGSTSCGAAYR